MTTETGSYERLAGLEWGAIGGRLGELGGRLGGYTDIRMFRMFRMFPLDSGEHRAFRGFLSSCAILAPVIMRGDEAAGCSILNT